MGLINFLFGTDSKHYDARLKLATEFDAVVAVEYSRIIEEIRVGGRYTDATTNAYEALIRSIEEFLEVNDWAWVYGDFVRGQSYPKQCKYLGPDVTLRYGDLVWNRAWIGIQIKQLPTITNIEASHDAGLVIKQLMQEGRISPHVAAKARRT